MNCETAKNDRNESPCGVLEDAQVFIDFCRTANLSSSSSSHEASLNHWLSQEDPKSSATKAAAASPSKEVHMTVHTASTSHHDDAHIHNINDANPSDSSTLTTATTTTNTNAVYFGWIRHPATKQWREAVRTFSENREKYPSWKDDLCDEIKDLLRSGDRTIDKFFVCRRRRPDDKQTIKSSRSITWHPATDQEILDRTKQRFIDDRKPRASRHRRELGQHPSAIAKCEPQLLNGDVSRLLPDPVAIPDNVAGDDQLSKQVAAITSTVPKENVLVSKAATTNNPLLETPQHTINMLQSNAVYFGWICRSGTKAWRDVVQCFSQNDKDFPVWTDDIHEKVMVMMRDEEGIVNYLICRQKQSALRKALFHKSSNKQQLVGEWTEATNDEILDRTRQRFLNDRKPQTKVVGAKRPRGRPPGSATSKSRCRQLD